MSESPQQSSPGAIGAVTSSQAEAGRATELVAFADCELIPINSSSMLVINRRNGKQQLMSPQVVEGLKSCTNYRTVAAHAAHLAATRPELQGKEAMAVTVLNNLNTAGILQRAEEVCASLNQPAPRELPPTRVFITTCDRPVAVERLFESILERARLSQHNAIFLVDDSREESNRDANRKAVANFNLQSPKEMYYVGEETQHALLAGLIDRLPAQEAGLRFLLDRSVWAGKKTYGRARILCQLFSVGYRTLIMDDDILCQAIMSPAPEAGFDISGGSTRQVGFFQSEQELLRSGRAADFDPLSGHTTLLGSTLGHAVHALNDGPLQASQLHKVNAALVNVLRVDSPILVTQSGCLGDMGSNGSHLVMSLDDYSFEGMLSSPLGMTGALQTKLNWHGSNRPNLCKMASMSGLTGLDNSQLLPPYFPAFRGEDGLFGAMVAAIHPRSICLEYPWSVPHLPVDLRSTETDGPIAARADIMLFARYLVEKIDYKETRSPQLNLENIARELQRMAALSDAELLLKFRTEMARAHADQFLNLQSQLLRLQKFNAIEAQEYIQRGLTEVQQALAASQSPVDMRGVPENATEAEVFASFRSMAEGYAAALAGWVEVREEASALAQELIHSGSML